MLVTDGTVSASDGAFDVPEGSVDPLECGRHGGVNAGETHPEERRRYAILNIPRHQLSEATGAAARRAAKPSQKYLKFSDQPIWLSLSVG
jgi:hypothetical protein